MKFLQKILVFSLIFQAFSCETAKEIVAPDFFRIYLADPVGDKDSRVGEVWESSDGGLLLIGSCSNESLTSPAEPANLYLSKIGPEGVQEWAICFENLPLGFAANTLPFPGENARILVWNVTGQAYKQLILKITEDGNTETLGVLENNTFYSCRLSSGLTEGTYTLLGLGTNKVGKKAAFLAALKPDFTFDRMISQPEYQPNELGGYGSEDLNLVNNLYRYTRSGIYAGKYFFNAPTGSRMTFTFAGNEQAVYSDSLNFVADILIREDGTAGALLNNPKISSAPTYYVPNISLEESYKNLAFRNDVFRLTDTDASQPVLLKNFKGYDVYLGTTKSGRADLAVFDSEGLLVKSLTFGATYPYYGTAMILDSKDRLVIAGFTRIENIKQRPFIIKIPFEELLK